MTASFAKRLTDWHRRHGRHDLPWQQTREPYRVWLSEIMLQQTQVATVVPYYRRFLERCPDLAALARASDEEVMALWSGLGYYARARNLHACARQVAATGFPRDAGALAALPGIGRSTANAIAVFCFGARLPILDGNVKRLLCRHAGIGGWPGSTAVERELWALAESRLPRSGVATYIQAQMDVGATLCTRSDPRCGACPVRADCVARRDGRTAELPVARPRRTLPERHLTLLILRCGERVLLERRPAAGVWGGLLSLPETSDVATAGKAAAKLGCRIVAAQALPPVRHTFTHFRLHLQPLHCQVELLAGTAESRHRWLGLTELAGAALPAPIRTLLTGLAATGFP